VNLVINVDATDKSEAAVVSAADRSPVDEIGQLILGNQEPLTIGFCDDTGATPAWVTDPAVILIVGLGKPDLNAGRLYTALDDFTIVGETRQGLLNLDTAALRSALVAIFAGPGTDAGRWLTIEITKLAADGSSETMALLNVMVLWRVLDSPASVINFRYSAVLIDNETGLLYRPTAIPVLSGGVPSGGGVDQVLTKNSDDDFDVSWKDTGAGAGTVTSVGLDLPDIFEVSGSPVTSAGTLAATLATQAQNRFFSGPATGADAAPTFRSIVAGDLPDLSGTYLTVIAAASIYLTQANAASTYLTQANAASTYLTQAAAALSYQPLATTLTTFAALGNTTGWLHNDGSGALGYSTPTKSDVGLGNVENTALSTWAGSTNLVTLGTITGGTWNGSVIAGQYGGTGVANTGKTLTLAGNATISGTNSGGANPTASIGLSAVNGSATTFLRSDGAPALSQAIAPTWTASHIWSPASGVAGTFNGVASSGTLQVTSGSGAAVTIEDLQVSRAGSTAGTQQQGPNLTLFDTTNSKKTAIQHSGGQTEFWHFASSAWNRVLFYAIDRGVVVGAPTGGSKGAGTLNATGVFVNGVAVGPGTIGGTTGSTDNAVIRADGTGGSTIQSSTATLDDSGVLLVSKVGIGGTPTGTHLLEVQYTASVSGNIGISMGDDTSGGPLLYFLSITSPDSTCLLSRNSHPIRFQIFSVSGRDVLTIQTAGTVTFNTYTTAGFAKFDSSGNITSTSVSAFTSGTLAGLTGLAIRDTSAAFDVTIAATSSAALTAGRTLTINMANAARTITFSGNPTLADWFDQSVKTTASPQLAGLGLGAAAVTNIVEKIAASITASSGIARGIADTSTYTAAAFADVITSLYQSPTVARGGQTGLTYQGILVGNPTVSGTGTIATAYGVNISTINVGATLNVGLNIGSISGGSSNFSISTGAGIAAFGDTTDASSTTVASVTVAGGLGVAKKSYFGDSVTITSNTAALPAPLSGTLLQLGSADGTITRLSMDVFANSAGINFRRANGTNASKTKILNGDAFGFVGCIGYDGTAYGNGRGTLTFSASQDWSATANGISAQILTTPNNTTTQAVAATFGNDGSFTAASSINSGAPSGGSGAGAWKLGTRISGAFAADLTKAVEIDIGGTLIRVAVLT
jgi:hypothetical protein